MITSSEVKSFIYPGKQAIGRLIKTEQVLCVVLLLIRNGLVPWLLSLVLGAFGMVLGFLWGLHNRVISDDLDQVSFVSLKVRIALSSIPLGSFVMIIKHPIKDNVVVFLVHYWRDACPCPTIHEFTIAGVIRRIHKNE